MLLKRCYSTRMPLRNTSNSYGSLAKWLHWISALLIIGMLIYGTIFTTLLPKGPLRSQLIMIHKSIGLIILLLIVFRWVWRFINPTPKLLSTQNIFLIKIRHGLHELLYITVILMLLSGILLTATNHYPIPFFGLFEIPTTTFPQSHYWHNLFGTVHLITAWTLTGLLIIHLFAVFKHHSYNKDETLKRML